MLAVEGSVKVSYKLLLLNDITSTWTKVPASR